jgi:hypothetical protein
MFFKSLLYPKIKRNDKYISNIKLDKIVVIQNNENLDNINSFYEKKKQNSPYNNRNIEKEYFLEICDKV